MQIKQVREFYNNNRPDLTRITDCSHRHFRFVLQSGRFLKIKDTIRNASDLQKWLVKLGPSDVYYSTATYLDPTSIKPRPKEREGYMHPSNILLGHDIAFDIDRQPLSMMNLERARKEAFALLKFMKGKGHKLKYCAFSGSKGFHLIVSDLKWKVIEDPYQREMEIIKKRKDLYTEVKKEGMRFDGAVLIDTRRIIRVPGTLNSKTGYCCFRLTQKQLSSSIRTWLSEVPCLSTHREIPIIYMPSLIPKSKKSNTKKSIRKTTLGYTTYLVSSVLGVKGRHAILMSFPKRSKKRVERDLLEVMDRYKLTDIYLFQLPDSIQAICLKTVQRNRYQKILDAADSASANQLRKYNRVSLRMGPLVNEKMDKMEPPAKLVSVIKSTDEIREKCYVSDGHLLFLRRHGVDPLDYPKVHGSEEFKVVDAELWL